MTGEKNFESFNNSIDNDTKIELTIKDVENIETKELHNEGNQYPDKNSMIIGNIEKARRITEEEAKRLEKEQENELENNYSEEGRKI